MEAPVEGTTSFGEEPASIAPTPSLDQKSETIERKTSSPHADRASQKKIVEVACWACRKRKAKCSGDRPACSSCTRRGVECSYEYEEGLTRIGSLRLKLHQSTARVENLEYLFEQLRTRSDEEAALLLAIIRLGADVDKIVAQLKTAPGVLCANPPDLSKWMADELQGSAPASAGPSTPMDFFE